MFGRQTGLFVVIDLTDIAWSQFDVPRRKGV
jgi:hypothetical protein